MRKGKYRSQVEEQKTRVLTLNDDGTEQVNRNLPPSLSVIDLLEE